MQTTPVWEKWVSGKENKLTTLSDAGSLDNVGTRRQGSVWPHVKSGLSKEHRTHLRHGNLCPVEKWGRDS